MPGNIRLTRDEMNNLLRNITHPSQSTLDARRVFLEELADLEINRQSEGVYINAPCIDFQGLDEALSRQKQRTSAIIKIGVENINFGKNRQSVFQTRISGGTNQTRTVTGKPDHDKPPFSTEESTVLAA